MTEEYEKQIIDAAQRTWDAIGFDVLMASGIHSDSGRCLTGSVVVEVVLDNIRGICTGVDFTEFNLQDYDVKVALIKKALPDDEYGY